MASFLYLSRRNSEARAQIAMRALASLFRRFTVTNVYVTESVKLWKTRYKTSADMRIFFTVYAAGNSSVSSERLWENWRRIFLEGDAISVVTALKERLNSMTHISENKSSAGIILS